MRRIILKDKKSYNVDRVHNDEVRVDNKTTLRAYKDFFCLLFNPTLFATFVAMLSLINFSITSS